MTLKFGTDGVRGVANSELTPELALALGRAAARVLGNGAWFLGRDTRRSGPLLTAALAAGLASEGARVTDLGVVPTPAVAYASAAHGVPAAVISASHNPYADNGIKLFSAGGRKLPDPVEAALEAELAALQAGALHGDRPVRDQVGSVASDDAVVSAYRDHLLTAALEGRRLDGLRVVVDCANGAASELAAPVLEGLGVEVTVLHASPDGTNINAACGSTYPADLQAEVVRVGADVGLAFDGDADRVLAVDAAGRLVDGDQIIAICAIDLHERGRLAHDTVVVTVMSNLGFRQGMAARGIDVVETEVGDRYVLAALDAGGYLLGGEQSGHVIFRDRASTGDGLLTGLGLLDVVARSGRSLEQLAGAAMTRLPQVLINVVVAQRDPDLMSHLADDLAVAAAELGDRGRILIRNSGTEPLVRVMVEAPTEDEAHHVASRLVKAVERITS
ncbi:MAG TPA: phosphoglucosamine mutase [Acidimicrobiales bacterium]